MEVTSNNSLLNLLGKTAIVTGGAMGIGLGIVARLAQAGANVMIADHDSAEAQKVAADLSQKGWKVKAVATDVSSENDIKRMVDTTLSEFNGVDILVNNAGVYPNISILKLTVADFQRVIDINLKGVVMSTKYAAEQMIKQGKGGKIINVTSIDAIHPSMKGLATYDASKHGAWGFTKTAALELAEHKIWVNAIAPGGITTPGVSKMSQGSQQVSAEEQKAMIETSLKNIPMHRMGEPDDIGKVALFLASDMASYITGSQIVVDGGALLS
jgi:2-dehydro-3-deoxy-D-gluconate 5-dehydrogenase